MSEQTYAMADPDYYAPVETLAELGRRYRPSKVPDGWEHAEQSLWTSWSRTGRTLPSQGWKVHVSARAERLPAVLDVFAEECFARDVCFKHVTAERLLLVLQHKHASRTQSGKLLVAYPDDEDRARDLMNVLSARLRDEQGQYILTDRRFGDSKVVHYRYGAFTARRRLLPDGTGEPVIADGRGALVPDLREPGWHLPAGIEDPFAPDDDAAEEPDADFRGFAFEHAVRHSNGGGAYAGRQEATGRKVFIKEARDHTGLSWDGRSAPERMEREWRALTELHAVRPGLGPEPLARFRVWEHTFLVTEFVEGVPLNNWVTTHTPLVRPHAGRADFDRYFADCAAIITSLEHQVDELHRAGYVFGDISPGNVLIGPDGSPRLIDFEAAHLLDEPPVAVATAGYAAPAHLSREDPKVQDAYGLSALVRLMLGPNPGVVERCPGSLAHLRADLARRAPVPPALWARAERHHPADEPALLPGPEAVAADPRRHVRALRDEVARALTAMADPERTDRIFPTVPNGYATNTVCVAYGTAGVLHALRQAEVAVDPALTERFRKDAVAATRTLAPGLHTGLAGVAWVLADLGLLDEAAELLATAAAHPLTEHRIGFADGAAGVATAHLALFAHTGDAAHVETAERLLAPARTDESVAAGLAPDDPTGWLHGRCGVAWALAPLGTVTGDTGLLDRGVRLLCQELDRAMPAEGPSPHFPVSATDRRSMPYLYCGTAGMLRAVARYNRLRPDDRLTAVEGALMPRLRTRYTVMPGLYQGLAGLGFALSDLAAVSGDAEHREHALDTAAALFKYAVPGDDGVRFLGDGLQRFSADLWSGSSGILLFLHEVLHPGRDRLFSLDRLCTPGAVDGGGTPTRPGEDTRP
ncbi:class III lanthionine synthetase LanKC [Streptomyces sp. MS06]|uniref:class III lanthionine synthetase LanKC n=1 Tax=Streptomyces sp. MS06 TaxID=3385974 RepID=UPI00399FFA50